MTPPSCAASLSHPRASVSHDPHSLQERRSTCTDPHTFEECLLESFASDGCCRFSAMCCCGSAGGVCEQYVLFAEPFGVSPDFLVVFILLVLQLAECGGGEIAAPRVVDVAGGCMNKNFCLLGILLSWETVVC